MTGFKAIYIHIVDSITFEDESELYRMVEGRLCPASKLLHLNSPGRNLKK